MDKTRASILFVTGGSGGIGKSTGARMIAQTLGLHGYRTCLVDGNPGQQSQRAWHHVDDSKALEYVMTGGLLAALVRPADTHGMYALLAGPADPHSRLMTHDYVEALIGLQAMCRMIVVDADRLDGRLWDDPDSFPGGVMRPMVRQGGARILFRVGQSGSQLDDGLAALDAIRMPDRVMAVGVTGQGVRPWTDGRWRRLLDGLASYGGVDAWSAASLDVLERHEPGWPKDGEPEWLKHAAVWAGADPQRFAMRTERKGVGSWFPFPKRG